MKQEILTIAFLSLHLRPQDGVLLFPIAQLHPVVPIIGEGEFMRTENFFFQFQMSYLE